MQKCLEAHRLVQYDKGGKPWGSRKATVNHVVAHGEGTNDLTRNVALVKMEQLTLELLESIRVKIAFFCFCVVDDAVFVKIPFLVSCDMPLLC